MTIMSHTVATKLGRTLAIDKLDDGQFVVCKVDGSRMITDTRVLVPLEWPPVIHATYEEAKASLDKHVEFDADKARDL